MTNTFKSLIDACNKSKAACEKVIFFTQDTENKCSHNQPKCKAKIDEDLAVLFECIKENQKFVNSCNDFMEKESCDNDCSFILIKCIATAKASILHCQNAHDQCKTSQGTKCLQALKFNDSVCNEHVVMCDKLINYYNQNAAAINNRSTKF